MKKLLLTLAIVFLTCPVHAQTTLYSNSTTGDVGVGTTNPQSQLHVYGGEVQVGTSGAACSSANAGALRYSSGSAYVCDSSNWDVFGGSSGGTLPPLTSADIWVGNGSNAATAVAMSGDCTISNAGAITCTKTNGTVFGTLATQFGVNLSTQATGTLQAGQFPALSGDVTTTAGSLATTVAKIQGTTVSGTTGTGNVAFSASPTLTGTLTAAVANFSGAITDTQAIGTSSTDGIALTNTTAATSGNQKWSPRIHFTGQGWKTNSTAGSQTVDMIEELQPVQGAANPSGNLVWSSQVNAGGYNPLMTLTTGGSVGIGTASPAAMLHVFTNGDASPRAFRISGTDANGYAEIQLAGDANEYRIGVGGSSTPGVANNLYFYDNSAGATRMIITSAGNVGIGTTSPSFPLSVNGTVNATQYDVAGSQLSCAGLSDCTTGSWTPTDQSGAALSLTVTHAEYKKIGNQMCVQALLTYPSTGSGFVAELGGLPANVEANGYSPAVLETNASIAGLVSANPSSTNINFRTISGDVNSILNSALSGKYIIFFLCYFTS